MSLTLWNVAHVTLMFYSCESYYCIQKLRSKSALAEIFNIIPTSLPFSIWLARMRERGRQPPSAQPCWFIKSEAFKEVTAQGKKGRKKSCSMHQLSWRVCSILKTVLSHFPMWLSYREVLGWRWHLEAGELWKSQSVCQKNGQKTTLTAHKAPSGLKFLHNVIGITRRRHPALSL